MRETADPCRAAQAALPRLVRALRPPRARQRRRLVPPRPSAAGANDTLAKPRHPVLRRHPATGVPALYWDLDRATGAMRLGTDLIISALLIARVGAGKRARK